MIVIGIGPDSYREGIRIVFLKYKQIISQNRLRTYDLRLMTYDLRLTHYLTIKATPAPWLIHILFPQQYLVIYLGYSVGVVGNVAALYAYGVQLGNIFRPCQ